MYLIILFIWINLKLIGHGGEEITLYGTNFGYETSNIMITTTSSNEKFCEVLSVNDTQIVCTLNAYEGGKVLLKVFKFYVILLTAKLLS